MRAPSVSPFERVRGEDAAGVLTLAFDRHDYEDFSARHRRGESFGMQLPMPDRRPLGFDLWPVCALEPGARAQVVQPDGTIDLFAPRVRCFAGSVEGGGTAFFGITEDELHGYFHADGALYFLASKAGTSGRATLARSSELGELDAGLCGFDEQVLVNLAQGEREALATPVLRTADVFIEADNVYRTRFTSDQACIDYTALLIAAASEIYRRDIGTRLRIPDRYLRVWNTTPPWGPITGFASLKNVYTWWQSTANPLRSTPRAAVHVLTSPVFGDTSRGVDGLCVNSRAYEISSVSGSFPYPIEHSSRYNWDLFVVCHEFGHTFGSPHSSLYSPPITCTDGSGPDSGTIMSYCHTQYGMAQVGLRFHYREQQRIRSTMDTVCMQTQTLLAGDYDGDGVLEASDLGALRGVLTQGFRSLAAEEVFDLDASGTLDDRDHDLLAQRIYAAPPAQLLPRNGQGINPNCLEALGNPVLGTVWKARIYSSGLGSSTLLVGYDQPLDGQLTSRGELLVKTTSYGGTKLFTSSALSDGVSALHEIPLPLDPVLFGQPVSFQALIVDGPEGDQYCNALDVILSPWE